MTVHVLDTLLLAFLDGLNMTVHVLDTLLLAFIDGLNMTVHVLDTLLLAFLGKISLWPNFKTRPYKAGVLCSQVKITDVLDRKL